MHLPRSAAPLARRAGARATVAAWAKLKPLGQDRYQIGRIVVDKRARSFTVPGRVHVLGKPLEYLATSPGGMKGYETLLELDASGSEFNLACILIGLERGPSQIASREPEPRPLLGPRVAHRRSLVRGRKASTGIGRGSSAQSRCPA